MLRIFPASAAIAGNTGVSTTSSTSETIGLGAKIFTIPAGLDIGLGDRVQLAFDGSNFMVGTVTSYVGTALGVTIDGITGSGTHFPWSVTTTSGGGTATAVYIATGAGIGKVLTSDASGNGSWQTGGGSGGISSLSIDPANFSLDITDIGADYGSAFSGLISSIDFSETIQGTVWGHINFKSSGLDETKDLILDLHHVFNGAIGSTLATRITAKAWVVDISGTPVIVSPTVSQTTDISVAVADTGKQKSSTSFLTVTAAQIPATCESIFISITREAADGNDTYTGTYQLTNAVLRQ